MFESSGTSLLLTAPFLATTLFAGGCIARGRVRPAAHGAPVADAVHVNHLLMGLAMLLMLWRPVGPVGTVVQAAVFALLAAILLLGLPAVRGGAERIGVASHVLMDAAMIWMLLAMPLLMRHATAQGGDPHAGHHQGATPSPAPATAPTPEWASGVHVAVCGLAVLVSGWWCVRVVTEPSQRLHHACHLLMALGMTLMLALM